MTSNDSGLSSREYQREAETTRHRLADYLDELNDRLTPGQVFDEVLSYARGGSGTFLRALTSAARENPVPSLLIGAGCLLLLSEKMGLGRFASGNGGSQPGAYVRAGARVRDAANEAAETMSSGAEAVTGSVRSGVRSAREFADEQSAAATAGMRRRAEAVGQSFAGAAQSARDAASGATQTMREVAAGATETFSGMREQVAGRAEQLKRGAREMTDSLQQYSAAIGEQVVQTGRQASNTAVQIKRQARSFVKEQPLLCAAIGLALGAALAAALPKTQTEDELMGERSDALKEKLGEVASEQLATAKAAASKVAQQAMTSAAREGLTAFGAAEAAGGLADKVRRVVSETTSAGAAEIRDRLDKQS